MKVTLTLILLLAIVACTTTKVYVPANENVNKREPASLVELQQGHDIFVKSCGKCHKLKKPDSRTAQEWTKVLVKMGPKAKLSKEQTALVYKYVVNY